MATQRTFSIEQQQSIANALIEVFMIGDRLYPPEDPRDRFKGTLNGMLRELAYQSDMNQRNNLSDGLMDMDRSLSDYAVFVRDLEGLAGVLGDRNLLTTALLVSPETSSGFEETMTEQSESKAMPSDVKAALAIPPAALKVALSFGYEPDLPIEEIRARLGRPPLPEPKKNGTAAAELNGAH